MRSHQSLIYHSPEGRPVPPVVRQWAEAGGFPLAAQPDGSDVEELVLRGANVLLVLDGDTPGEGGLALLRRLKHDAFTAVVPAVVVASHHEPGQVRAWFEAGADEVVTDLFDAAEQRARVGLRDVEGGIRGGDVARGHEAGSDTPREGLGERERAFGEIE